MYHSFVHSFTRSKIKLDHDEAHSSHKNQSPPISQLGLRRASLSLITLMGVHAGYNASEQEQKGVVMEIGKSKTI
jgi:hypothetical protein